jgi:hypothetical protein
MENLEPKPPVTLWTTPGLLRDCFIFFYINQPTYLGLYFSLPTRLKLTRPDSYLNSAQQFDI